MTTHDADVLVLEQLRAAATAIRRLASDALIGARAGLIEQELNARLARAEAARKAAATEQGRALTQTKAA